MGPIMVGLIHRMQVQARFVHDIGNNDFASAQLLLDFVQSD